MRPTLIPMIAGLIFLLTIADSLFAQPLPTLVIEPDPPTAQQPFTATVTYDGPCFIEAQVEIFGQVAKIVAIEEPICVTVITPRTFDVEIPGLPAGSARIVLARDPEPTMDGDPPEMLIESFDIEVAPSDDGIVAVGARQDGDQWVIDIVQACPSHSVFIPRPLSGGLLRLRQVIPPNGVPIDCAVEGPFLSSSAGVGPLEPGAYTIAIEALDAGPAFDWLEPFTVPEPNDLDAPTLQGDRFQVRADWQRAQDSGSASARKLSDDSAAFWFFRPSNTELLVKVLDGCETNGHYWVFAAGLTNQGVVLRVDDLGSRPAARVWRSPLGSPFMPILDTRAFACAP